MTVSEQIIQVINDLCTKLGIAINWTGDNVIPYIETLCKKLVTYEIATSAAQILLWILICIAAAVATKKLTPVFKKGLEEDWNEGWEVATVFSILGLVGIYIAALIVTIFQIGDIIKCVTFPEMYVFEYIQKLIQR